MPYIAGNHSMLLYFFFISESSELKLTVESHSLYNHTHVLLWEIFYLPDLRLQSCKLCSFSCRSSHYGIGNKILFVRMLVLNLYSITNISQPKLVNLLEKISTQINSLYFVFLIMMLRMCLLALCYIVIAL